MIFFWALAVAIGVPVGTMLGYVVGGRVVTRMASHRAAFLEIYRAGRLASYLIALPAVILSIYLGAGLGFSLTALTGPNLILATALGAAGVALVLAVGLFVGLVGGASICILRSKSKAIPS